MLLLYDMLSEDGVIFISCDDNELYHLKNLLDEIFEDHNWVGTIIWRNVTDNNPTNVAIEHEYILCFSKNKTNLESSWKSKIYDAKDKLIEIGDELNAKINDAEELQRQYSEWFRENKRFLGKLDRYKFIDKKGVYTGSQSVHNPGKEGYRYDVIHPVTKKPCKQPLMGYRFAPTSMDDLIKADKILYGEDENKIIELKVYARDFEDKLASVIVLDGRVGAYDLRDIFPEAVKTFDNPKPVDLIKQLLSFVTSDNDIVLDSYAGSGTTGQAVLELNLEDGGNRRFVLVQMDEFKDGGLINICEDITKERMHRVIQGVPDSKNENLKEGLGGSFSYFELGEEVQEGVLLEESVLPSYEELARHLFFTATGEQLDPASIVEENHYIGESSHHVVWLWYVPNAEWLKLNGFTVEDALKMPEPPPGKRNLVFGPMKYMADDTMQDVLPLRKRKIQFLQLPYEIYRMAK